jgi:hypothetical protein
MRSRFLALRIRPANRDITPDDDGTLPEAWLLAEWPTGADEPTDYLICILGPTRPWANWCAWPRSVGGSNTTVGN